MKGGRESKGAPPPSADLLVCFPSRARLSLMPKPICSPNSEPNNRRLKKINTRPGPVSPLLWDREITEPTSPKVTCAGQIKVRHRSSSSSTATGTCRNWQSVMEEIERLHTTRSRSRSQSNHRKSKHWAEALGFKKDIVNFLTCLGNLRFDFRCFGSFPDADISSDEEEEEEEEEEEDEEEDKEKDEEEDKEKDEKQLEQNTVFSKWFMVLQEEHQNEKSIISNHANSPEVVPPPPNALLLMRCRSAPAKRFKERRENDDHRMNSETELNKKKKRESLAIVMKYDADFYNLSSDVSKETWLVDGFQDTFSRSTSWKR